MHMGTFGSGPMTWICSCRASGGRVGVEPAFRTEVQIGPDKGSVLIAEPVCSGSAARRLKRQSGVTDPDGWPQGGSLQDVGSAECQNRWDFSSP